MRISLSGLRIEPGLEFASLANPLHTGIKRCRPQVLLTAGLVCGFGPLLLSLDHPPRLDIGLELPCNRPRGPSVVARLHPARRQTSPQGWVELPGVPHVRYRWLIRLLLWLRAPPAGQRQPLRLSNPTLQSAATRAHSWWPCVASSDRGGVAAVYGDARADETLAGLEPQ